MNLTSLLGSLLLALAQPAEPSLTVSEAEALLARQQGGVASRLVKLTRSDEFFLNTMRMLDQKMHGDGKITDSQLACLREIKTEEYNQILAVTLAGEYDDTVLQKVFEFFSSPFGARYMRMVYEKNWRQTPRDFPLPMAGPREYLAVRDFREMARFRETGVPRVFYDPRMITQWDSARQMAAVLWRVKSVQCGIPEAAIEQAIESFRPLPEAANAKPSAAAPSAPLSEAAHDRAALDFIRMTQMDEFEFQSHLQTAQRLRPKYQYSDKVFACITSGTREDFASVLLPGTRSYLSQRELESGNRFYGSGLGGKYLRAIQFEIARMSGDVAYPLPVVDREPAFDMDEFEALVFWMMSPDGRKAGNLAIVADQSEEAVLRFIGDRYKTCKKMVD
jgi:hypothetical protein